MKVINYVPDKAKEVADLFYESIHSIDPAIYATQQQQAWAPLPIDYDKWKARLGEKKPYLLIIDNYVAGFIELESNGHIDCLYVSPKFQKRGVASALLKHVIHTARNANIKYLHVEASIIAKPLFTKFGFELIGENNVVRNNLVLINYSMRMQIK